MWDAILTNLEVVRTSPKLDVQRAHVRPPASRHTVEMQAKKYGVVLPKELEEVLTDFSETIDLDWRVKQGAALPARYHAAYRGGMDCGTVWFPPSEFRYLSTRDTIYEELGFAAGDYLQIAGTVGGDCVAIDVSKSDRDSPVLFIAHDGCHLETTRHRGRDDFQGRRLATSFVDFIYRWSFLGFADIEQELLETFYDHDDELLLCEGVLIDGWCSWLHGKKR